MTDQKPLIILTGPTAVGKTALSISLAKAINGEVVSADSMQVYRHMDIGTAKISQEEMGGIPHHLIDILEPTQDFNVTLFQTYARTCVDEILKRGHIPIVVGGTGFYIQALLYDIDFIGEDDSDIRSKYETLLEEKGAHYLHKQLQKVDPTSAEIIHENNHKRMIRALEFYERNKSPISVHNQTERSREAAYHSGYFVLTDDRQTLYERIDRRVDQMMEAGLYEEVLSLKNMGCTEGMTAMQGIGYRELMMHFRGELTREEAVSKIKLDSRHFAKRQLTWFRREKGVIWIDKRFCPAEDEQLSFILTTCREKGILS